MAARPWLVEHYFGPPYEDGGGVCTKVGRYPTLELAIHAGASRLVGPRALYGLTEHDRIAIRLMPVTRRHHDGTRSRRGFRPRHPVWLYLDGTGRLCRWELHPSQPLQLWGYASSH